jgi:hypothetical protein
MNDILVAFERTTVEALEKFTASDAPNANSIVHDSLVETLAKSGNVFLVPLDRGAATVVFGALQSQTDPALHNAFLSLAQAFATPPPEP